MHRRIRFIRRCMRVTPTERYTGSHMASGVSQRSNRPERSYKQGKKGCLVQGQHKGHERELNRFCKRAGKGASQRVQATVPCKEGTEGGVTAGKVDTRLPGTL
jgi:hypothetical protein